MDQNNKEEIKIPEKRTNTPDGERRFDWDKEKDLARSPEKKEFSSNDEIVSAELRREIELMEVDENLKKEAEQKANKIQFLADDDKLKKLLDFAKEKGIVYAIQVAKKMNEPFLLDAFHDILAREGFYQKFVK